jgi:alpha-galactosidase
MLPLGRISVRGERGPDRMTRLTHDEQTTLMTLWCIFRSPLMFGGDLPSNDEFTLSLLTNDEVLAVDQKSANGHELFNKDGLIAWVADVLRSKDKYVALFNTRNAPAEGPKPESVQVTFADIGLSGSCEVRDLWSHKDLGEFSDTFASDLPNHGAGLYRIRPK